MFLLLLMLLLVLLKTRQRSGALRLSEMCDGKELTL